MIFNRADIQQIEKKGIPLDQAYQQLDILKQGIPHIIISAAATLGNGIVKLSKQQQTDYATAFDEAKDGLSLLKFIPASGAASRMFSSLFEFLKTFEFQQESLKAYLDQKKNKTITLFFSHLERFPFHNYVLDRLLAKHPQYKNFSDAVRKYLFVKELLTEEGCNYGSFPKALLPFHNYTTHLVTAFEAQLLEAARYASSRDIARLHFTITNNHLQHFEALFQHIRNRIEAKTKIQYQLSFSTQKEHTDTLTVYPDDNLYRKKDHTLFFRPSGHGALLENLNDQEADMIFIKNIDNVVVSAYEAEMAFHKKVLAGKLLEVQKQSFAYARYLDSAMPPKEKLNEVQQFLSRVFNVMIPKAYSGYTFEDQIDYLKKKLNRPIRICGMVRNESDPGGGPFWVKGQNGHVSLQIVETAQVDVLNLQQKNILNEATHFNPVDMVCSVKNYKGEKYDLQDYADHHQAFITQKNEEANIIKVLERPGLWNGSMAHWNSIFIEVPVITFNPVKTITDLLKPAHQAK